MAHSSYFLIQQIPAMYITDISSKKIIIAHLPPVDSIITEFSVFHYCQFKIKQGIPTHIYKKSSSLDAPFVKDIEKNKICRYCGDYSPKLTRDHVKPKSYGYSLKSGNMILCCEKCNRDKGCRWLGEWIVYEFKTKSPDYAVRRDKIQKIIDASFYLDPDIFDEWNRAIELIDSFSFI